MISYNSFFFILPLKGIFLSLSHFCISPFLVADVIKQKRNEGYSIVYLDETWVDTHHTAPHQWTPPNPSDSRKIPLSKGQTFVILHAFTIKEFCFVFEPLLHTPLSCS
jgi:hypothetical protein